MKERGISLIALIITIIVIIILAVVVVASAADVIEDARFAKFEQEFGEYSQALQIAATQKKAELISSGRTDVTDAQVYYMVAKGLREPEPLPEGKSLAELEYDIQPSALTGTTYYEVTRIYTEEKEELGGIYATENNPALNRTTPFYSSTEKVYVTDRGEAFTLPGFPRTKNGVTQNYVNEKKYYTGENSGEITSPTVYAKLYNDGTLILSSTDYTSSDHEGVKENYGTQIYVEKLVARATDEGAPYEMTIPQWITSDLKNSATNVIIHDKIQPTNLEYWFFGYNGSELDLSNLDTSLAVNMNYMFEEYKLSTLDVSNFDVSKVTMMYRMFYRCTNLQTLDLSNWDIQADTENMFYGLSELQVYVKTEEIKRLLESGNVYGAEYPEIIVGKPSV